MPATRSSSDQCAWHGSRRVGRRGRRNVDLPCNRRTIGVPLGMKFRAYTSSCSPTIYSNSSVWLDLPFEVRCACHSEYAKLDVRCPHWPYMEGPMARHVPSSGRMDSQEEYAPRNMHQSRPGMRVRQRTAIQGRQNGEGLPAQCECCRVCPRDEGHGMYVYSNHISRMGR